MNPELKTNPSPKLSGVFTVIGYALIGRDNKVVEVFQGHDAAEAASMMQIKWSKDAREAGVDWSYSIAAMVISA